jgi:hypothetical protein
MISIMKRGGARRKGEELDAEMSDVATGLISSKKGYCFPGTAGLRRG